MSSFSAPQGCSTTLSDTITLTGSNYSSVTTTANSGYITSIPVTASGYAGNVGTVTISNGGTGYTIGNGINATGTISVGPITTSGAGYVSDWNYSITEFVNSFPDFNRVQKMCDTYPGLKIAYEKFVTTYKLVKDDYDNPNKKES